MPVDIILNRRAGIPLRDQIVAQVEMRILAGDLARGEKLPSVRDLAARLGIHPRTVHAAYRQLQLNENITLQPGSGAYVSRGQPGPHRPAEGLQKTIDALLREAIGAGLSLHQIRCAARRWLDGAPPRRAEVIDNCPRSAEIMAAELRAQGLPCDARSFEAAAAAPEELGDALLVCLPFHASRLRKLLPSAQVAPVVLEIAAEHGQAVIDLAAPATILVVSHSPRVAPYARAFIRSLRGDEVEVTCHLTPERDQWMPLAQQAGLVLADVLAAPEVQACRPDARLLSLLGPRAYAAVRAGLTLPPPPPMPF